MSFRGQGNHAGRKRFQHRGGHRGHRPKRGRMNSGEGSSGPRKSSWVPKQDDSSVEMWMEQDIGILEYMSSLPGFSGVIKQRYSDFLVNELKQDGTEVHLTDFSIPKLEVLDEECKPASTDMSDIISKEIWEKISEIVKSTDTSASIQIPVTKLSKDGRRLIHQLIKKVYGAFVDSDTSERDGEKFINVRRHRKDGPKRNSWPSSVGEYVHFCLYKENMDTMEAISRLASKLRMKANALSYAGTKDRRAKTCQRVCIRRTDPQKLVHAARAVPGVSIGNFEFLSSTLQLGQLAGNRFQIVLRNITASSENIEEALNVLKERGFLNYFGLQRFGTQSVPTHHVGRALLQGNWQEAVELILKPRGHKEQPELQEARQVWWDTRDSEKALKSLQNKEKCIEAQLLQGLTKCHKNDLVNALENVPRNTRLMYLHAYQSYIWNSIVSRRVKEQGLQPIEGDLILEETYLKTGHDEGADKPLTSAEVDANSFEDDEAEESESKLPAVRALTKEDLAKFTLQDVVLPLPGHQVTYPGYAEAWYEELLAKDNLSSATLKQNVRKYSLGGAYRRVSVNPNKLSWRFMTYLDATKPLLLSDLDILRKKSPIEEVADGEFKALLLDFCLPPSVYATMLLRELLKCDTSVHHQSSLNSYSAQSSQTLKSSEDTTTPSSKEEGAKTDETSDSADPSKGDEDPKLGD